MDGSLAPGDLARLAGCGTSRDVKRKRPKAAVVTLCPTPAKALYRSAAEARAAAVVSARPDRRVPLKAYRCRCGFWHLASDYDD